MDAVAPLQVAVVGMSYWGPNLARNFDRIEGSELRWACDLDEALLERHRGAFPRTRFTTDLDEVDIARVQTGQQVDLTFDALPDKVLRGRVARVAPMSTRGQTATTYTVLVEFEGQQWRGTGQTVQVHRECLRIIDSGAAGRGRRNGVLA